MRNLLEHAKEVFQPKKEWWISVEFLDHPVRLYSHIAKSERYYAFKSASVRLTDENFVKCFTKAPVEKWRKLNGVTYVRAEKHYFVETGGKYYDIMFFHRQYKDA